MTRLRRLGFSRLGPQIAVGAAALVRSDGTIENTISVRHSGAPSSRDRAGIECRRTFTTRVRGSRPPDEKTRFVRYQWRDWRRPLRSAPSRVGSCLERRPRLLRRNAMLRKSFIALAMLMGAAVLAAPATAQRHHGGSGHGRGHSGVSLHVGGHGYGYSSGRRYSPRYDRYYSASYAPAYYGSSYYDPYYDGDYYSRSSYDRGHYRDRYSYRSHRRHQRRHRRHH